MSSNIWEVSTGELPARIWTFGVCEWNEATRELRVNGAVVEIETKPLEVLSELLHHAGEVVTKEELLDAVWANTRVVDGSLATAVSKLRKALGDEDQQIVLTMPRIGYRLGVPVHNRAAILQSAGYQAFAVGDGVPGREQWVLQTKLASSDGNHVWLAEHSKTRERRVFKFAFDGTRLKALKREATLARFLKESLGERPDFVRALEWNFETEPFYLESEYGGQNLTEWAESQGGLTGIPLETRLQILMDVANAVAAAHELGILHKDLKPANILVTPSEQSRWQIRVVDFGSSALLEPARLGLLGITNLGFTQTTTADSEALSGTMLYLAPELLAGHSPTTSSDVYALGVMLYQLIAGDFRKPLSAGWEAHVHDRLLREDVADAASGDATQRLSSAATLARRLQELGERRTARNKLELAHQRAEAAEQRLSHARARRPWVVAAVAALALGLVAALFLYRQAALERDRASQQTEISSAVSRFLADDLLGQTDPFQSSQTGETLVDAAKRASANIDRQFAKAPAVAGRLHQAMARALDSRSDFANARGEYQRAIRLFEQAGGDSAAQAIIAQIHLADMEARTYDKGCLDRARALLAGQEAKIEKLPREQQAEARVWLEYADGMVAVIDNDAKGAAVQFEGALLKAKQLPAFDEVTRLNMLQRLGFASMRSGDGPKVERISRELIAAFTRLAGPDNPNVLRARLQLAQAFMIQRKHREAIQEVNSIYPAYVAKLGESHQLSMQALATRATSEGYLGIWSDVIRDNKKLYELALRKQGPLSFYAVASLSDAALVQCRGGLYREGVANARLAFERAREGFGIHAGLTGGAADTLASCLIDTGRVDEAADLIRQINTDAVTQLTGTPDWIANIYLSRSRIALSKKNYAEARSNAVLAKPILEKPGAEPYQKNALTRMSEQIEMASAEQ